MGETYIGTRELGKNTKTVIDNLAPGTPAVITVSGKPRALLVPVSEETLSGELAAWRARDDLRRAVADCRAHLRKSGRRPMTMREIDAVIAKARRERRRGIA
ncbi:MAG: hypothetical protein ACREIA_05210 [Opitutaceae bacterium]